MSLNYDNMITEICDKCGEKFKRPAGRRRTTCALCGAKAIETNAVALHAKSGPYYEKFIRKGLLFYRSEATRLGIKA